MIGAGEKKLGDLPAGLATGGRLVLDDPGSVDVLERYATLADASGGWAAASDVLERVLPHMTAAAAREWRRRFGQQRLEHDEDVSAVVAFFRPAGKNDSTDLSSLEGLLGASARVGAWDEHAETLEQLATLAETPDLRMQRLRALAETWRDRLLAPKRAAAGFGPIAPVEPQKARARGGLVVSG